MVLEEDEKKNRLHESLKIWQKLTGSPHFENASFILLFNKCDIFEKKLTIKPLSQMFVGYNDFAKERSGASEFEIGWKFMEDLFMKRFNGKVQFETLVTNSTDKADFDRVWLHISEKIQKIGTGKETKGSKEKKGSK
jgi:hypothetical protein